MDSFLLLIVLAITYNQGAARPADNNIGVIADNGLASSEEGSQIDSGEEITYNFPRSIRKGLVVTIKGTLNTADKSFTVALPSTSGGEDCQIKFNFEEATIYITPPVDGYATAPYNLNVSTESEEALTFVLRLIARTNVQGDEIFAMTFKGNGDSHSGQLICKIKNFDDINSIVMKEGVAHVDSLLFEFEKDH